MRFHEGLAASVIAGMAALAQGCTTDSFATFGDTMSGIEEPVDVEYYADDKVLAAAKNQFEEGNYGHAQHYYKRAVAVAPNDAEAWLGLAASYDRIRRFDEADKAYRRLAELIGG